MTRYLIAHIGHTTKHYEHIVWWKPDSCGYTICIDKAGEYSEEEARGILESGLCMAVPREVAEVFARSHPYYRRENGGLAPLYDGTNHRPVPNSMEAWAHIKANTLPLPHRGAIKPTTIGRRARAIYLPADDQQKGGA